jgi:hypothetical protein
MPRKSTGKSTKKGVTRKKVPKKSKLRKVLTKVMNTSLDIAETLAPIVLRAAKNVGYTGTIGGGITVLSLLADSKIGKEAARLLIQKTKEVIGKSEKALIRDTVKETDMFTAVEEEINFEQSYRKPTLKMNHWEHLDVDNTSYRGLGIRPLHDTDLDFAIDFSPKKPRWNSHQPAEAPYGPTFDNYDPDI